jgi:DNA-binding response OmpR family regulator
MARILSISYDETLLRTRELMLRSVGHQVTSAYGYHEALELCAASDYELTIVGHSIPEKDKLGIIDCVRRQNPNAIVIALTRAGERRIKEVDHYVNPGDPEELLRSIGWILNPAPERRASGIKIVKSPAA